MPELSSRLTNRMAGQLAGLSRRLDHGVDRIGVPDTARFPSRLHDRSVAARLGIALGVTFTICFVTGLVSHFMQTPPAWLAWPSRPISLYRVNQGLHVLTGVASVPLLLAKLWTVYPLLFQRPILKSLGHGFERLFILLLVGGATFQLVTGLVNIASFYPWGFDFRTTHYAVAWVAYGALVVHVAYEIGKARAEVGRPLPRGPSDHGLTRRGFLGAVGAAGALLVVGSAGRTVGLPDGVARWLSPFASHLPNIGPQGFPVRTPAAAAGVTRVADADFRLVVAGAVDEELSLTLDELGALPQTTARLPITCVEGWSAVASWSGVALRDLLARAGVAPTRQVRVVSLQEGGSFNDSVVKAPHVQDPLTLLATTLDGEPLHIDHGFPCRLIAPNRPGVLQTKWVTRVEVLE